MKKLFRTSIEQTGIAIFLGEYDEEIYRPMFSNNPCAEARDISFVTGDRLKDVFYSNNLLDYKIEDIIKDFVREHGCLPENYVEELVNGFPFIIGRNTNLMYCYK